MLITVLSNFHGPWVESSFSVMEDVLDKKIWLVTAGPKNEQQSGTVKLMKAGNRDVQKTLTVRHSFSCTTKKRKLLFLKKESSVWSVESKSWVLLKLTVNVLLGLVFFMLPSDIDEEQPIITTTTICHFRYHFCYHNRHQPLRAIFGIWSHSSITCSFLE